MGRGIEKPHDCRGDGRLVTLAGIEQREPFEGRKLVWRDLDGQDQAAVPAPISVGFAAFACALPMLVVNHAITRVRCFSRCS
jgi:hypothetical protein